MKSCAGAGLFQCVRFLGQWLGHCRGSAFLIPPEETPQ